jgi:hypothetical protein
LHRGPLTLPLTRRAAEETMTAMRRATLAQTGCPRPRYAALPPVAARHLPPVCRAQGWAAIWRVLGQMSALRSRLNFLR